MGSALDGKDNTVDRKQFGGSFPLDCIGEVLLYVSDSSVAFSVLLSCKRVKLYIEKTNPVCLKNVLFEKDAKYFEKKKKKKGSFLSWIFPKKEGVKHSGKQQEIKQPRKVLFVHRLKIEVDVTKSFWKMATTLSTTVEKGTDFLLSLFPNLTELELFRNSCSIESCFVGLPQLQKLSLSDCQKIKNRKDAWKGLTKLRVLKLNSCDTIDDTILECIPNLESISVINCREFEVTGFKSLKKVRSVVVEQCSCIYIERELVEALPKECTDIKFEQYFSDSDTSNESNSSDWQRMMKGEEGPELGDF